MYSPFCSRSVSRSRATFQKGPSGIFSSLLARAAHTPELCSGVVAVLLEYPQKASSLCKHSRYLFMHILIAARAKKRIHPTASIH
jgi:hypothetical protein